MNRQAIFVLLLSAAGCDEPIVDIDLERMIDQRRADPYGATTLLPGGHVMQDPPRGTVRHGDVPRDPRIERGLEGNAYVDVVPVPVSRPMIERGRNRYDVFCAPCHGILGDGNTQVAENMVLRRPPSLVTDPVRSLPVGRVFEVMTLGFGLMRPYDAELSIEDRWAVVAYLRALQRSQAVALDELPAPLRASVEAELR